MANNFFPKDVAISNANLTDVFTATNKTLVAFGTLVNTGGSAINVSCKRFDHGTSTSFDVIAPLTPIPSGGALQIPKTVLETNDKLQAKSDNASGTLTVVIGTLQDVA
tara:strand:+ start:108 stop:431 length:324 start_codon:yes stop_codon:yes gene_type:complete